MRKKYLQPTVQPNFSPNSDRDRKNHEAVVAIADDLGISVSNAAKLLIHEALRARERRTKKTQEVSQ